MSAESEFEPVEAFSTFDDGGQPHEVQVWAEVTYSINDLGHKVRSVGMKHLRMADSGSVVHSHLDGSLAHPRALGPALTIERTEAIVGGHSRHRLSGNRRAFCTDLPGSTPHGNIVP
jgi:hypothetical protein